MVLVSSSQEMEDGLRDLLVGLPPLKRVGASLQAVKEAMAPGPPCCSSMCRRPGWMPGGG